MIKKVLAVTQIVLLCFPVGVFSMASTGEASIAVVGTTPAGQQYAFPDASISVSENTVEVGQITLIDEQGNSINNTDIASLVYIDKNIDDNLFQINSDGVLVFVNVPDFENPADQAGAATALGGTAGDNVYRVGVRYDIASTSETIGVNLQVTVVDVEEPPIIEYNEGENLELVVKNPERLAQELSAISEDYSVSYTGGNELNLVMIFDSPALNIPRLITTDFSSLSADTGELLVDTFSSSFSATGTQSYSIDATDGVFSDKQYITVLFQNTPPVIEYNDGEDLEITAKDYAALVEALEAVAPSYIISDVDQEPITATATVTLSEQAAQDLGTSTVVVDLSSEENVEIDIATELLSFTGGAVATGTYTVLIEAEDIDGEPASNGPQTITINIQNTPPVIEYNGGEDLEITAKDYNALLGQLTASTGVYAISDVDDDAVNATATVTLSQQATLQAGTSAVVIPVTSGGDVALDIETELLSFVQGGIATGTYTVLIEAEDIDGEGASNGPQIITINIQNTPPFIEYNNGEDLEVTVKDYDALLEALTATSGDYVISDYDGDEVSATATIELSLEAQTQLGTSSNVVLPYTSSGDLIINIADTLSSLSGDQIATGTYVVTVEAQDEDGSSASNGPQIITINIQNTPPVIEYNGGEDLEVTAKDYDALLEQLTASSSVYTISDVDGDAVTATVTVTLSQQATLQAGTSTVVIPVTSGGDVALDIETELLSFVQGDIATGTYTVLIEAEDIDGEGASNGPQTIEIVVTGETKPEFTSFDGADEATVSFTVGDMIEIQTEAVDIDGDEVLYSLEDDSQFVIDPQTGLVSVASGTVLLEGNYVFIAQVEEIEVAESNQKQAVEVNEVSAVDDTQIITVVVDPREEKVTSNSQGGGGGRVYACRDEDALNYKTRGTSDPRLCEYNEEDEELEEERETQEEASDSLSPSTPSSTGEDADSNNESNSNTGGSFGTTLNQNDVAEDDVTDGQEEVSTSTDEDLSTTTDETVGEADQSASIIGSLLGDKNGGCSTIGNSFIWATSLVLLVLLGIIARVFTNPQSVLYRIVNNPAHVSVAGLSGVLAWFLLDGCLTMLWVPASLFAIWATAILARDASVERV